MHQSIVYISFKPRISIPRSQFDESNILYRQFEIYIESGSYGSCIFHALNAVFSYLGFPLERKGGRENPYIDKTAS